jgi:peptide/nickel transport system permease protein
MSRSKSLQYYIIVRLMLVPLMLLTITTVVFLLLRATPGDPVDAVLGVRAPESVKQEYRLRLGLLDPLWLQYVRYLGSLLRLDLGETAHIPGNANKEGNAAKAVLSLIVSS